MKIIRVYLATTLVLFLLPFISSAQKTGPAQEEFYNSFASAYLEISKPPMHNYFVNLNKTIKYSFATENKFFAPALAEMRVRHNIKERDAADSLFIFSMNKLIAEKLWANNAEVYSENELAFKGYEQALCPCITANFKATYEIDKMMPVLQQCITKLVSDTAGLNSIRRYAGDKTLNDIFKNQQYFSLYIYQNCDVVKRFFNEILRSEAYVNYTYAVASTKRNLAQNVLNYYRDKKIDSLAIIFPAYKKYVADLNAALVLTRKKNTQTTAHYSSLSAGRDGPARLRFYNTEVDFGNLEISFANPDMNAVVTKITFKKAPANNNKEQIIETREDTAVPVKQ